MTEHWAGRLRELATEEDIPGATLAVWADGRLSVAGARGMPSLAGYTSTSPGTR
jgi:hypothetical protein